MLYSCPNYIKSGVNHGTIVLLTEERLFLVRALSCLELPSLPISNRHQTVSVLALYVCRKPDIAIHHFLLWICSSGRCLLINLPSSYQMERVTFIACVGELEVTVFPKDSARASAPHSVTFKFSMPLSSMGGIAKLVLGKRTSFRLFHLSFEPRSSASRNLNVIIIVILGHDPHHMYNQIYSRHLARIATPRIEYVFIRDAGRDDVSLPLGPVL